MLFRGCRLQPHLRLAIAQRDVAPFRIGAQVEFAARRLGPDVFPDQLPERSLSIQKPFQVFAIGAYLDQASRAAIERPVVDLRRSRDLELVLQLRVVLRRHASLLSGGLVAHIHGALDLEYG